MYRFVCFDLDQTAIRSDGTMSERLREAVRAARAKGVMATIATGRIYPGMKRYADFLGITDGPIINAQGSIITDAATKEILYKLPMEWQDVVDAVNFLRERGIYRQINLPKTVVYEVLDEHTENYARKNKIEGLYREDILCDLPDTPVKVLGFDSPERIQEVLREARALFSDRMEVAISAPVCLEITHKRGVKGNGMRFISEHYGIPREEMIAIGDSLNDLSMIEYAGLGVAMANSQPEVLAIADVVVPSNDDDGVAFAIEKFILNA